MFDIQPVAPVKDTTVVKTGTVRSNAIDVRKAVKKPRRKEVCSAIMDVISHRLNDGMNVGSINIRRRNSRSRPEN